jgi:hypothetical protein
MRVELREHYIKLVNFLGMVLGPTYEIALHDLSMGDETVIAIANGQITNRTLGAPLTNPVLGFMSRERYKTVDYEVNYTALSVEQKSLRSSTFYIKDANELVGLLCITFDDTPYRNISKSIMSLCHPDELLSENKFEQIEDLKIGEDTEIFGRSIEEVFKITIESITKDGSINMTKLKKKEKIKIVSALKEKGIFLLKGAVPEVALLLNSSEATIYRYLSEVEKGGQIVE